MPWIIRAMGLWLLAGWPLILMTTGLASNDAIESATGFGDLARNDEEIKSVFECRPANEKSAALSINDWRIEEVLIRSAECKATPDANLPEWYVFIQLTDEGANTLERFTRDNLGRPISIKVDGVERSAPVVQTPITQGAVRIMDGMNKSEACALARRLAPSCDSQ